MGAGPSSPEDQVPAISSSSVQSLKFVEQLIGAEKRTPSDHAFWNEFLSLGLQFFDGSTPQEFDRVTEQWAASLLRNNPSTSNFQSLLVHLITRLVAFVYFENEEHNKLRANLISKLDSSGVVADEVTLRRGNDAEAQDRETRYTELLHALFWVRIFARRFVESLSPEQLERHCLSQSSDQWVLEARKARANLGRHWMETVFALKAPGPANPSPSAALPPDHVTEVAHVPSSGADITDEGSKDPVHPAPTAGTAPAAPTQDVPVAETDTVLPVEFWEENILLGDQLPELLLRSLIGMLTHVRVNADTYALHIEAMNTLLVLMSTQMFDTGGQVRPEVEGVFTPAVAVGSPPRNVFLDAIMDGRIGTSRIAALLSRLLGIYAEGRAWPKLTELSVPPPALWLPPLHPWAHHVTMPMANASKHGLADRALLVSLVLLHQYPSDDNPARVALRTARDTKEQVEIQEVEDLNPLRIPFEQLYQTLAQRINGEATSMLFYTLLNDSPFFFDFVRYREDLHLLVVPMLRQLYDCDTLPQHKLYMFLIALVILTHDAEVNRRLNLLMLTSVPWAKDYKLNDITVASLAVVVLARVLQTNLKEWRDAYVESNVMAALANMSSQHENLHEKSCVRLLVLLKLFVRAYRVATRRSRREHVEYELEGEAQHETDPSAAAVEPEIKPDQTVPATDAPEAAPQADDDKTADKRESAAVAENDDAIWANHPEVLTVSESLKLMLEIINATLTHALVVNPNLVYEVMRQQAMFKSVRGRHSFASVMENIEKVITHFNGLLSAEEQVQDQYFFPEDWSVDHISRIIKTGCLSLDVGMLKAYPAIKFNYEEEASPEQFFAPLVWSLVFRFAGILWSENRITLFALRQGPGYVASESEVEEPTEGDGEAAEAQLELMREAAHYADRTHAQAHTQPEVPKT